MGITPFTGRPARSAAMFLLSGPKKFFAPQGRHVAPINVKFGTKERTAGLLPVPNFTFIGVRNVGIQPPKLSKFRILAINLPLRGHSFSQFLQNSQILYASPGGFSVFNLVVFEGQITKL